MASVDDDRVEPLFVLYGSQMGNAEQHATEFCESLKTKFTGDFFKQHGLPENVTVEPTCIQLDDFLEMHHASYTKVLVIFVSSYGVGQAPMGSHRFREICEAWKDDEETKEKTCKMLKGLKYFLCGLGDSGYPTYLKNPTTIDAGLTAAGATRIGEMGKADAKGRCDEEQDKVIVKWVENIWLPLAKAICANDMVDVKAMQSSTIPWLMKLDPDYTPPQELVQNKPKKKPGLMGWIGLSLLGVVLGIAAVSVRL